MNRGMAGVTALAALALAACGGLPESLKLQVAAEKRQFAASRKDFEKARDDVKAKLAHEPELARIRGLLWQPALDRDTEKFNEAGNELKQLEDLRRQDRKDAREEVERLLAGERRIRAAAVDDARAMQSEAQRFTTLLAFPALGLGAWLWLLNFAAFNQAWMHAKLLVVVLAIGYHHSCARTLTCFEDQRNTRSHVWWRWFNELPVLLLVAAVVLVVVKPWQG